MFLAALGLAPFAVHAQNDQQQIVDRTRITVTDLSHDKAFGNARQVRTMLIVPRLLKGGFIVGGEGGKGVRWRRTTAGSTPSVWHRWGLQQSKLIPPLMTQQGLDVMEVAT